MWKNIFWDCTPCTRHRLFVSLLIVIGLSVPLTGDELTLREAVNRSLNNNLDIQNAREKITEMEGQIREARSRAYPRLDLNVNYSKLRDPGVLNSSSFEDFSGGKIRGFNLIPEPEDRYNASIEVEQNIFTWGRIPSAIKGAKYYKKQVESDLRTEKHGIALETIKTYFKIKLVKKRKSLLEKARSVYEEQLRVAKNKIEAGDATRLAKLKARVAVSNLVPDILGAKKELELRKKNLNILLNRDVDRELTVSGERKPVGKLPEKFTVKRMKAYALANRPELESLKNEKLAIEMTADVRRSELRPSVFLKGSYGRSVSDYQNLNSSLYNSWSVSLNVNIPLFDGFKTRGKLIQTFSKKRRLENSYLKTKKEIFYEITDSYKSLKQAKQRLSSAKIGVEKAEEAFRMVKERHGLGLSTNLNLLDTERQLRKAKLHKAEARYDYRISLASLKKALGLDPLKSLERIVE